jgi:hypothetical protein
VYSARNVKVVVSTVLVMMLIAQDASKISINSIMNVYVTMVIIKRIIRHVSYAQKLLLVVLNVLMGINVMNVIILIIGHSTIQQNNAIVLLITSMRVMCVNSVLLVVMSVWITKPVRFVTSVVIGFSMMKILVNVIRLFF